MKSIKKIICLLLVLLMIPIFQTSTLASVFSDLSSSHWAYKYIMDMVNAGVLDGYEDGTFRPDANVTRGEMWKISVLALASKLWISIPEAKGEHWAERYATAIENYSSIGYSDSYLGDNIKSPDEIVDRAETAMLITSLHDVDCYWGYGKTTDAINNLKDKDEINKSGYGEYIYYVTKFKFMCGYEDGCFHPERNLTRAELCTVLHNVFFNPHTTGNRNSDINKGINTENPSTSIIISSNLSTVAEKPTLQRSEIEISIKPTGDVLVCQNNSAYPYTFDIVTINDGLSSKFYMDRASFNTITIHPGQTKYIECSFDLINPNNYGLNSYGYVVITWYGEQYYADFTVSGITNFYKGNVLGPQN